MQKIGQSGELLGTLLNPDLPLTKDVLEASAKTVLFSLGLAAAASATDDAIQKNVFESGMTTLIISNKEINDIRKIVKSLEEYGFLIKGVSETIEKKAK